MSRNGPLPWMAGSFHFYGATRELVFARLLERMSIGFQVLPPGQVCKNASVPRTITIALIISCNSPIHPTAARERRLASRSELADSGEVGESPKWGSSLEAELAIRDPCTLPLPSHLLHQLGKAKSSRNPLCFQSFNRGVHGHRHQKGASRLCHVSGSQLNRPDEGCPSAEAKEAKFAGRTRQKPQRRPPATPPEMIAEAPEAPDARSCGEHFHARRARHRVAGRVLSPHRSRRDADSSIHRHAQSGTSARKPDAPRQSWLPPQMQRQLRWRRRRLA